MSFLYELPEYQDKDGYLYPEVPMFDVMILITFSVFFPVVVWFLGILLF